MESLQYLSGFGNHFATEALPGTLPEWQNSPQKVAHGLYAEQLSGSSFLAARHENLRSWVYRIHPSVQHGAFKKRGKSNIESTGNQPSPEQMRWNPMPVPTSPTDFLAGLTLMAENGRLCEQKGVAIYLYACNKSMEAFFYSADGEMLFVPQDGALTLKTELGWLNVAPKEIAVIPRGVRFQVAVSENCRGYVCENFGTPLRLPQLGPIGSNGLANPRDFLAPVARFEDREGKQTLVAKFSGALWEAALDHSPLDVVAWHGNYAPYKYDLTKFNTIGTISYDHPDPSIFTVLTAPSETPGMSNIDFVIFPPRWLVAEHTFRPPYYHRNVMSEWMGLITGVYDAKAKGFLPGGSSLHNTMSGHGPDTATFEKASTVELKPQYVGETLAFMFESRYPFAVSTYAQTGGLLQKDYMDCWKDLPKNFEA